MLPRGEMPWRRRMCVGVLIAAIVSCIGAAPSVGADADRHFEKVSPADKGNGDVVGDGGTNLAAPTGDAITMSSRTPFGDTVGSGVAGQTQYVARRGATAWEAHSITPQSRPESYQTFFVPTRMQLYSEDLSAAVVWAYDLPYVSDDLPLHNNIYFEDTATRTLKAITGVRNGLPDPLPFFLADLQNDAVWGASADARNIAFVSAAAYVPEAAPGVPNVYQWDADDGVISLAGILPDRRVAPPGGSTIDPTLYRASMSRDGTRLVFSATADANQQLYMRINDSETVQISENELDPRDQDPSGVIFNAMTPDGRTVFFTTTTPLVREDANGGGDLYRWTYSADPSRDANLRVVSNGDMQDGELVGMSDDGEVVYYQTPSNVLAVSDHGATRVISTQVPIDSFESIRLGVTASRPGLGRVTPDGRYLAFSTNHSEGQLGPTGEETGNRYQMYFYDLGRDTLSCISCPADAVGPIMTRAFVTPAVTNGTPAYVQTAFRPRFLSEGGQAFFSTPAALAPEDRNGVDDVYEYDPVSDSTRLISTGKGSDPVNFTDASASGDDVFVVSRQRLTADDRDGFVDLYDARRGDALPTPPEERATPACEGETCQPPPSAGPSEELLGSLTFDEDTAGEGGVARLNVRNRLALRGAAGTLRVKLPEAGRLAWSGRGLRTGSVRRGRAGAYELHVRLARRARTRLSASGAYTTTLRLTFSGSDGVKTTATSRITFRAAAKKGNS